jgi:hypothetical protein
LTYAQQERLEFYFKGDVMDEQGQTLPGANIVAQKSRYGTTSNRDGRFLLKAEKGEILKISFIGFVSQTIVLNDYLRQFNLPGDTIYFKVQLLPDSKNLKEFTVTAKSEPLHVFGEKQEFIWDYELQDDKIWLLLSERGRKRLVIVNQAEDTLFQKKEMNAYKGFHKDPFGSIFLLEQSGALYVDYFNNRYSELRRLSDFQFNNNVLPLTAGTQDFLYFKSERKDFSEVLYQQYDKKKDSAFVFYHFINVRNNEIAEEIALNLAMLYKDPNLVFDGEAAYIEDKHATLTPKSTLVKPGASLEKRHNQKKQIVAFKQYLEAETGEDITRMQNEYANFLAMVLKPQVTPLKIIRDTVYIFNHTLDSIFAFAQSGEKLYAVPINYHHKTLFSPDIIVDEENGRVYFKNLINGIVSLEQIDLKTGKVTFAKKIEGFNFPEKLSIKNDFIYFIHKDKNEPGKRLYKLLLN